MRLNIGGHLFDSQQVAWAVEEMSDKIEKLEKQNDLLVEENERLQYRIDELEGKN